MSIMIRPDSPFAIPMTQLDKSGALGMGGNIKSEKVECERQKRPSGSIGAIYKEGTMRRKMNWRFPADADAKRKSAKRRRQPYFRHGQELIPLWLVKKGRKLAWLKRQPRK